MSRCDIFYPCHRCTIFNVTIISRTYVHIRTFIDRYVESSWNVMAHGDAREGKWRGNWRREWVARTLHTTSEHGIPSITTADPHASAASSRLNWRPRRFKWTRPFYRKTKFCFSACAITFHMQFTHPRVRARTHTYTPHTHTHNTYRPSAG